MEGYYTQNRQLFYYNGIVTNISFVFENTPAYKRLSRNDDKSVIGTALVNVIELSLLMTSNIFKAYDGVCFQSSFSILYYEAIRSLKNLGSKCHKNLIFGAILLTFSRHWGYVLQCSYECYGTPINSTDKFYEGLVLLWTEVKRILILKIYSY